MYVLCLFLSFLTSPRMGWRREPQTDWDDTAWRKGTQMLSVGCVWLSQCSHAALARELTNKACLMLLYSLTERGGFFLQSPCAQESPENSPLWFCLCIMARSRSHFVYPLCLVLQEPFVLFIALGIVSSYWDPCRSRCQTSWVFVLWCIVLEIAC